MLDKLEIGDEFEQFEQSHSDPKQLSKSECEVIDSSNKSIELVEIESKEESRNTGRSKSELFEELKVEGGAGQLYNKISENEIIGEVKASRINSEYLLEN